MESRVGERISIREKISGCQTRSVKSLHHNKRVNSHVFNMKSSKIDNPFSAILIWVKIAIEALRLQRQIGIPFAHRVVKKSSWRHRAGRLKRKTNFCRFHRIWLSLFLSEIRPIPRKFQSLVLNPLHIFSELNFCFTKLRFSASLWLSWNRIGNSKLQSNICETKTTSQYETTDRPPWHNPDFVRLVLESAFAIVEKYECKCTAAKNCDILCQWSRNLKLKVLTRG